MGTGGRERGRRKDERQDGVHSPQPRDASGKDRMSREGNDDDEWPTYLFPPKRYMMPSLRW